MDCSFAGCMWFWEFVLYVVHMVDVVCYAPNYDQEHRTVLQAFAEGCGAEVRDVGDYRPCDVAVVYGMAKHKVLKTMTKRPIIEKHRGMGGRALIVIDSAPVLRGQYWAVGWNGLGGNANFCNEKMPPDRWNSFGVELKPWSFKPTDPVVVCGQVPWDANVQDTDHVGWCQETLYYYMRQGVAVWFRPHPRMNARDYGFGQGIGITFNYGPPISIWHQVRCLVTWNSTIGTDAAINGIPVIALDPGSFAYPIAAHSLKLGFNSLPELPPVSRTQWAANLAYCQWNLEELRSGLAWKHLTRDAACKQSAVA